MKLSSNGVQDGAPIPARYAFFALEPNGDVGFGGNLNPDLSWSDLPEGTESLVLICHDADAPESRDGVDEEGVTIAEDAPRRDFYHWLLIGLSPDSNGIVEGAFSNGVVEGGKDDLHGAQDTRQGINDLTGWLEDHPTLAGEYVGYDGPAPPKNDARLHHVHFTLYALETDELGLGYWFTAEELFEAMDGYVLAEARLTGTYTLNPELA